MEPQSGTSSASAPIAWRRVTFTIDPTPAFEQFKAWCAKCDIAHGSQKRFGGMMGERFKWDANNDYPRYLGVRAKPVQPQLRVVSSH